MTHCLWKRLLAAAIMLGAAACDRSADSDLTPARREARRHYIKALDHVMRLQFDGAAEALRASLLADAAYLPALADQWLDVSQSIRIATLLDTAAAQAVDKGVSRCMQRSAAVYRGVIPRLTPAPPKESIESRQCAFYVNYFLERPFDLSLKRDSILALARLFPESPSFQTLLSVIPLHARASREVVMKAVSASKRTRLHPFPRVYLTATLARALHEIGDDSSALELEQAMVNDPSWRLPGFRLMWAGQMQDHVSVRALNTLRDPTALARHADSTDIAMDAIRLALIDSGDLRARLSTRVGLGVEALDRGQLDQAIQLLGGSVPLVDSLRDSGVQAYVRMRLGRALVKAGRAPEAERILLAARLLGDSSGITHVQKEVEHNLLHLYESVGRDDDAFRAGEAFVRFASASVMNPVRMMSARDVGLFLRARGRIEESRPYFDRMLADIDSLNMEHYYAGEYREMTGALDEAREQYQRSVDRSNEAMRGLSGLVRVAMAMGDTADARRWAATHDARRDAAGRPEASPLLPGVLWRTAGGDAARTAFLSAREEVARHSQVSAWASLTADLATLEHDANNFARSAQLADSAVDAARSVGATETLLRARALGASARARQVRPRERRIAIEAIRTVAAEADRTGGVLLRADLHRLVASAFVSAGALQQALEEYKHAVVPLDSVAGRIAMDPGQAGFRSAQRRAYDEALAAIVHNANSPGALGAWAEWSTRRKGRTYAVRLAVDGDRGLPRVPAGTAIVDYVVFDTMVAALVVTSQRSSLVPLTVKPAQVRADVGSLRSAVDVRVGSSLDVRRARFPLEVAHRLYRGLLEPLEPHLADARMLVVVPDGILSLVPFDALVTRAPIDPTGYANARYVLDRWIVVNATTLRAHAAAWRLTPQRMVVVDPGTAPAAAREVDAIHGVLRGDIVKVLRGSAATPSRAIAEMGNADIVHFIAHGEANEHDPGSSRIDLSPDDGDDGRLDASQVAALRLHATLVVLSACETANGRVLDGEGVLSMSRSFLRAGARATVATLWPVGAAAADFAEAFYESVSLEPFPAGALRSAKLTMRAKGATPATWAPYQLFIAPVPGAPGNAVARSGR